MKHALVDMPELAEGPVYYDGQLARVGDRVVGYRDDHAGGTASVVLAVRDVRRPVEPHEVHSYNGAQDLLVAVEETWTEWPGSGGERHAPAAFRLPAYWYAASCTLRSRGGGP